MRTIHYNENIDFIYYMFFVSNMPQFEKKIQEEISKQTHLFGKDFKELKKQTFENGEAYYASLSFIQKNYLDLFFKNTYVIYDFLLYSMIQGYDFDTITKEIFIGHITRHFDGVIPTNYDETLKLVKAAYDAPHIDINIEKSTNLVLDILTSESDLEGILQAIASLKDHFVESKLKHKQQAIEEILSEHRKIYEADPNHFLSNITNGQLGPKETTKDDMKAYYVHFSPYILTISIGSRYYIYSKDIIKIKKNKNDADLIKPLLKFLSDPKRYEMLKMLKEKKWYANELAKKFKITPATMSYHVNKLFDLELIYLEPGDQNKMYIILDKKRLASLLKLIQDDLS